MRFFIGDLRTGSKIQWLNASSGSWSEELNNSGQLECTIPLYDPVNYGLDLFNSAPVAKTFLAAVDGDLIYQAGPIWNHRFDGLNLTLQAAGMWSYFDHRVILPVLAGRLPTDATTDTRFSAVVSDPEDPGYPWAVDTRQSLRTIAKRLVEQAQTWTGGNVPVVLPSEEAGTSEWWFKGSDLAPLGEKLRQITGVSGGPDIMFTPRWLASRQGIEWVLRVGTTVDPLLHSGLQQTFQVGVARSSIVDLSVAIDGGRMGSTAFGTAGATTEQPLAAVSTNTSLLDAGYPELQLVASGQSTVSEASTLQGYTDALVWQGMGPTATWTISHNADSRPYSEAYNAGDFAKVRVRNNLYLPDGAHVMRLLRRSGRLGSEVVSLEFAPEVSDG